MRFDLDGEPTVESARWRQWNDTLQTATLGILQ